MNGTTSAVSTDEALRLLADRDRREVLRYLIESEGEAVRVDELAAALADGSSAAGRDRRGATDGLAADLYHDHLPKLADAGVVHYDPRSKTTRYRSRDGEIEALLRFVRDTLGE